MPLLYKTPFGVQEKTEEKLSHADRLRKLKVTKEWTWVQIAEALGVSESHVYAVLDSKTGLGDIRESRLVKLEKDAGIYTEQSGVSRVQERPQDLDHWMRRALRAEEKLAMLRVALRDVMDEPAAAPAPAKARRSTTETDAQAVVRHAEERLK